MSNLSPVAGKVIAITGAAQGIALALAKLLASRGAVLSLADLQKEALEQAAEDIRAAYNVPVITFVVDVRDTKEVEHWISKTVQTFKKLDGAANMAGVIGKTLGAVTVAETDEEDWKLNIDVNLTGLMHCLRAQLQVISDGGSIVNAASIAALIGRPYSAAYAASKHGVIGLSRSAAKEVGDREVRVNCIAPGPVNTPMNRNAQKISSRSLGKESDASRRPLKRFGEPEEIASLVAFLLGDESRYITGAVYSIDGGWYC